MSKLHQVAALGQAIWLDYIQRAFLANGGLSALIQDGLRGVTSNPSIFQNAIATSIDYDEDLARLAGQGKTVTQIYEALVLDDIGRAADMLRPVYDETDGADGFVSLEVSPELADDAEGTVHEARRFVAALHRPNVLIKVPATPAGVPAIETLISEGINVNVTLIFSLQQYEPAARAYISGLERRLEGGEDISHVASVASFFLSRVDTAVDRELEARDETDLQGKIAIANAKLAYSRFEELFAGERWERLASQGARAQRPLWASTSTKDPRYPDTMYIDELIGPHTVNTVPPATLNAFREHGSVAATLTSGLNDARARVARLAGLGVDLDAITATLQRQGVQQFVQSFEGLRAAIAQKRARFTAA
ncbi:MAG: transaldolase [Anaerolineae bacterium]|nr:transaldolase [Anaerolineae bacterium]